MPVSRGQNTRTLPLKIVGSSVYGIYTKMDSQITYNMTISDQFLVPYPGYKIGINSEKFNNAESGRALYESVKLGRIIAVFDQYVYLIDLKYSHQNKKIENSYQVTLIGQLQTSDGVVYITENNKPQILISDGTALYLYDQTLSPQTITFTIDYLTAPTFITIASSVTLSVGEPITFTSTGSLPTTTTGAIITGVKYYVASIDTSVINQTTIEIALSQSDVQTGLSIEFTSNGVGTLNFSTEGSFQVITTDFVPGYISFHDTYFLAAASADTLDTPVANNTWRLSSQNNGFIWANIAQSVGLLETKPDDTQAVVRFPSKGNMILVMGKTVTEFWFDTGAQLFPYQRQNQGSIDYGCLNPATVAFMDEIVVWLARNEKSGPVIMYTSGGLPQKVTTDGIDYQLSQLETPQSAQGFLFRKNGHLFYHINFYDDNISFIIDFTANKIYNACDQDLNYFSMGQVVWFENQYFSITKDSANLFIFDTVFSTYEYTLPNGETNVSEIPRIRVCDNIRLPSQDYFILNDIGFTIETGETDYYDQSTGPIYFITEDGNKLITNEDEEAQFITEDGNFLVTQANDFLITETPIDAGYNFLISEQEGVLHTTPRVDMSVSYDGGASYGADFPYVLNPIGKRKNKLSWWQGGMSNDIVCQFKFWGVGRVVVTDGQVNIRQ